MTPHTNPEGPMPKKPRVTFTDGGAPRNHVNVHVEGKEPVVVHEDDVKQYAADLHSNDEDQ